MITLIYASSATKELDADELLDILASAKRNNDGLGITGMLLYKGGNFLQVLEGEEETVMALYDKIKGDPRHYAIQTIMKRKITQREFADWKMGFANLDELDTDSIPGYSEYLEMDSDLKGRSDKPSITYTFLKNFKDLMR